METQPPCFARLESLKVIMVDTSMISNEAVNRMVQYLLQYSPLTRVVVTKGWKLYSYSILNHSGKYFTNYSIFILCFLFFLMLSSDKKPKNFLCFWCRNNTVAVKEHYWQRIWDQIMTWSNSNIFSLISSVLLQSMTQSILRPCKQ